ASITGLTAGTVVVMTPTTLAPTGYFRKVTGLTVSNGLVAVATVPAALTDAFDSADMAADTRIGDADVAQFLPQSAAIQPRQPTLRGRTLAQGAPEAGTAGASIGLRDGKIVVQLGLSVNAERDPNPLLNKKGTWPIGGRIEAELDIEPQLTNKITINGSSVDS